MILCLSDSRGGVLGSNVRADYPVLSVSAFHRGDYSTRELLVLLFESKVAIIITLMLRFASSELAKLLDIARMEHNKYKPSSNWKSMWLSWKL